jgi:monoamine oxidase
LIGHHDDRKTLFLPEENVLFFAGEATAYFTNPQTVHGAIETGYKAADLILQSLSSSTNKP